MSLEQALIEAAKEIGSSIRELAAAIRERNAAGAAAVERIASTVSNATVGDAELVKAPKESAKDKQAEADRKAAADKAIADAKAAAAAAKAKEQEAGDENQPDFDKVVYPKLLEFVNKHGKDAWTKLANEFKNDDGVAPKKGKDVLPKHYAALVARIDEEMAEGGV